jgi:drug/metabolite transporter (DMT)-like permease
MILLTKTNIFWIALLSLILLPEERALIKSRHFWAGLTLSAIGLIGVMVYKVDLAEANTVRGIIIALTAALMWGVYTVAARIAFRNIDSRQGFSVLSTYTVVGLVLVALPFGNLKDCVQLGAWQWACVVISGITAIALAHTLYYTAMRRIGATIPALVILAQPFVVLGISNVVFNETLNVIQLFFGVVLLSGAALAIWAQQHLKSVE